MAHFNTKYKDGDLVNGTLLVRSLGPHPKDRRAIFKCNYCGNEFESSINKVSTGTTKSCRCLLFNGDSRVTHGATRRGHVRSEYKVWSKIKKRCFDDKYAAYKDYGARGIVMCEAWSNDFQAFLDHVGDRPSMKHSIDRIDNSKGYEPGNVRWATMKEQCRNRRTSRFVTYRGTTKTLAEWCEKFHLNYSITRHNLDRKKMPPERAFFPHIKTESTLVSHSFGHIK